MEISEIFQRFEQAGVCTFATVENGYPETRVAHFLAADQEGLYFETMVTKPFYRQLKSSGKVSVCGLAAPSAVTKTENGSPLFEKGFFIRLTGDVREVTPEQARRKNNPDFDFFLRDCQKYPQMTGFVIYRARGEIYDYDFEKEARDHKLERQRFSFGGLAWEAAGLTITEECVHCRRCMAACTFDAIEDRGDRCVINGSRCDECGNCLTVCPVGAVVGKGR